jgi:hypothetical protein
LRPGLLQFGRVHADLGLGRVAAGQRGQVILVGVVQRLAADNAFLLHEQIAVEGGFVHGQIRRGGVHLVLLDIGLVGGHIGLGGGQLRALRLHLGHDLLLVKLRQLLALVDDVVDVHIEFLHDSRGFAFDLDLGDGLDFSGGHDGTRHIAARHRSQPVGVNRRAMRQVHQPDDQRYHHHGQAQSQPDPESLALACCRHKDLPERKNDAVAHCFSKKREST